MPEGISVLGVDGAGKRTGHSHKEFFDAVITTGSAGVHAKQGRGGGERQNVPVPEWREGDGRAGFSQGRPRKGVAIRTVPADRRGGRLALVQCDQEAVDSLVANRTGDQVIDLWKASPPT